MARAANTVPPATPTDEVTKASTHWMVVRVLIEFDRGSGVRVVDMADTILNDIDIVVADEFLGEEGVRAVRTNRSHVHSGPAPT